jgi:hypothetical protein
VSKVVAPANRPESPPGPLSWRKSPQPLSFILHARQDKEKIFPKFSEFCLRTPSVIFLTGEALQGNGIHTVSFSSPLCDLLGLQGILKISSGNLGKDFIPVQEFPLSSGAYRHVAVRHRFQNNQSFPTGFMWLSRSPKIVSRPGYGHIASLTHRTLSPRWNLYLESFLGWRITTDYL